MKLEGKRILITGGSRGLGRAILDLLTNQSNEIHVVSRNFEDCEKYSDLKFHCLDLTLSKNSINFAEDFLEKVGIPDVLINNAGTGAFYDWENFPVKEIEKQINLLFTTPVYLSRVFAPLMAEKKSGVIVNISSLATLFPLPFMPMYNASKSALSSFSQSLMLEYSEYPKIIDARFGDFRSEFNKYSSKQKRDQLSLKSKNAWEKIEDQLEDSPDPHYIAKKVIRAILKNKSRVVYGGGFFQAIIAPLLSPILPYKLKLNVLSKRYSLF